MRTVSALVALASASLVQAAVQTKAIEYKHADTTLVGFLAWDDAAKDPRPGVLVCPEWWGNNEYAHARARQLAELGYVAFAIDMYGKDKDGKERVTSDPKVAGEWSGSVMKDAKLRRERAASGLDVLAHQGGVDAKRLAAIGYCMGGSVALELARTGADLKAVVAFHASRISADAPEDNKKIRASVLVCHGQDDGFVQPGEIDKFHAQMKEAGVDYEFAAYAGAVHAFTNPKADEYKLPGVGYNAKADRRSWDAMKALFAETLSVGPGPAGDAPPPALTKDQIGAMDLQTAMKEMASRRKFVQANAGLDANTRHRLDDEVTSLKERIDFLRKKNARGSN